MMHERGMRISALEIVRYYGKSVDIWIIDETDRHLVPEIEALGCVVRTCSTLMRTLEDKIKLARVAIDLACGLSSKPLD